MKDLAGSLRTRISRAAPRTHQAQRKQPGHLVAVFTSLTATGDERAPVLKSVTERLELIPSERV